MTNKINKKHDILKFIIQIIIVSVAGIVGGCTFKTFFEPFNIIPTGLSGFALIIHNLFASIANIPTSVIYLVINVILFAFAFKIFGWKFIVLSIIGVGFYTLAMQFGYIEALANSSDEKLLFAVIGGMLSGACVGLALRFGGSTGGSDVLGALINKWFPKIKTGYSILIVNAIVLTLSIITSGVQTGLYALVISVISSMSTNMLLDSSKRVVAYYIICDKDEEIADAILQKYHRGVTRLEASGMFSKKNKAMLLCLVPFAQASEMKKLVNQIDSNAFVFSDYVNETVGDGDFLKEVSIFKNKVKKSKPVLKTELVYIRHKNMKKVKYPSKRTKYHKK